MSYDFIRNSNDKPGNHTDEPPSPRLEARPDPFYGTRNAFLVHSFTFLNRKAFPITETELKLIAAPAIIGLNSKPKKG